MPFASLLCFPDLFEQRGMKALFIQPPRFVLIAFMKWVAFAWKTAWTCWPFQSDNTLLFKIYWNLLKSWVLPAFLNDCISLIFLWNLYPVHRQMGALKHDINQKEIQNCAVAYGHLRPSTELSPLCQSGQRAWNPPGSAQRTTPIFMQIEHFTRSLFQPANVADSDAGACAAQEAAASICSFPLPWQSLC